ncbi:putative eka-like protein [Golovinomyces cichoracearum]|uniref:Putative eka-like protein n=1 Tax=Golovinomyces cichoracearum TaxID=62708 RepID=A0A420I8W8_9PEZI|nr:putative eka-like protein [Golovinomyces cichoracearum]
MEPKPSKPSRTSTSEINEEWIDALLARRIEQILGPFLSRLEGLSSRCNKTSTINIPENAPTQSNFTPPSLHDRKRRKFPTWDGEKKSFGTFIREVEDCIEIDRDILGSDRAIWYDINFSLPSAAKCKVAVFNSSGAKYGWDYKKFIEHLKGAFGNRQEKEDKQELLATIKQKDTQRFSDFFPKFDEVLSGAGGEHWTEDSK